MARKIKLDIVGGYPALGRTEGTFEVDGLEVADNLAVNNDLDLDDAGDVEYRKTWNVTHVPTGWALVRELPSQGAAKAVAELLAAMGYGAIDSDDPRAAAEEAEPMGLRNTKAWIREQVERSRTTKSLVDKLSKEARRAARGGGPAKAAKRGPAPPRHRKKTGKKASKKQQRPRAPAELDLIEKARRIREGNPGGAW